MAAENVLVAASELAARTMQCRGATKMSLVDALEAFELIEEDAPEVSRHFARVAARRFEQKPLRHRIPN